MKRKLVAVGVLAGAVALTGVAGSAYAQSGGTTPKKTTTTAPAKGQGPILVSCVGGKVKGKDGKPEKGFVTSKEPGKFPLSKSLPGKFPPGAPPSTVKLKAPHGAKAVTVIKAKGKPPIVKVGKPPKGMPALPSKGVHCTTAQPGAPAPTR